MSMLLSSHVEVLGVDGKPTGEVETMTDAQVRDEVLTIFLAGFETTAKCTDVDVVPAVAESGRGSEDARGA